MPTTPYQMAVNNVAAYINGPDNNARAVVESNTMLDAFTASTVLAIAFCKPKEDVLFDIVDAARKENDLPPTVRLIKRDPQAGDTAEFTSVRTGLRYKGTITMINQAKGEPIQALYVDIPGQGTVTFVPDDSLWRRACNDALFTLDIVPSTKGS